MEAEGRSDRAAPAPTARLRSTPPPALPGIEPRHWPSSGSHDRAARTRVSRGLARSSATRGECERKTQDRTRRTAHAGRPDAEDAGRARPRTKRAGPPRGPAQATEVLAPATFGRAFDIAAGRSGVGVAEAASACRRASLS